MKSGKFWHLVPNRGFEAVLAAKIKLKTLSEVKTVPFTMPISMKISLIFCKKTDYRESLLGGVGGALVSWDSWGRCRRSQKRISF
jgi:hypothetical protein